MRASRLALVLGLMVIVGLTPVPVAAQMSISGQVDFVAVAQGDSLGINRNLRGDSPFSSARVRLFARHWVTERIGVFGEFLFDIDADPRINGAYVVINDLWGQEWLSTRLGVAPQQVGSFALRSTYFNANPLIGVPLLWHYRTNLESNGAITAEEVVARKGSPATGSPMLYEACWLVQWELMGESGRFEYSVAMSPGALSNPQRSQGVDGSQFMGRLGVVALPGLRIGLSAAHGPYVGEPFSPSRPAAENPEEQDQQLVGVDLEYGRGRFLFHSEVFAGRWEAPLIDEDLTAWSGYVEGRFDFLPGWYAAGRVGWMRFGDITVSDTDPLAVPWDDDVVRTEVALGHRLSREVLLKADWQRNTFAGDGARESNLFALQLSTVF